MITVLHLQARELKAEGLGDLTEDTGWSVAELESFRNGRPGLATDSLQLGPLLPPPPQSGGTWPVEPGFRAPPLSQQVSHSRQWLISE